MLEAQKTCRRQGKHSVRLYADRTRRGEPGTPSPLQGEFLAGKKDLFLLSKEGTPTSKFAPHKQRKGLRKTPCPRVV